MTTATAALCSTDAGLVAPRRPLRSVAVVLAGLVAHVLLAIVIDWVLNALDVSAPIGAPIVDRRALLVAAIGAALAFAVTLSRLDTFAHDSAIRQSHLIVGRSR